jgi:FK506-binding nuclear protein
MAAIDPDEAPEYEDDADSSKPARATLKIVRAPPGLDLDEEDSDDEDYSDEDEEEDSDEEEETNGGPSDKEKARKLKEAAAMKDLEDAMEEDSDEGDDEDFDLKAAISKLIKGKGPALDDEDDESEEGLELDENVICTLSPTQVSLAFFVPALSIECR